MKLSKIHIKLSMALALCLILAAGQAFGATYYVDPAAADDTGAGTSEGAAWKTIAKVNASSFSAGDSILFKRGGTWREQLYHVTSGSSGSPITFGAYGTGAMPIISGSDSPSFSGVPLTSSDPVALSNTKISLINGTAFADFGATINLAQYATGTPISICSVTNSAECITGYIKAAGTGETLDSELLGNTTYQNTTGVDCYNCSSASVAGGQTDNCLQITTTSGYGSPSQQFSGTIGVLIKATIYVKKVTATEIDFGIQLGGGDYHVLKRKSGLGTGDWVQDTLYVLLDTTSSYGHWQQLGNTLGYVALFDTSSVKKVLSPSTSGVTITSTSGGTTYNWATSGFSTKSSFNDSAGYTFTLGDGSIEVYRASCTTSPNQVLEDGNVLASVAAKMLLTPGTFYYNSPYIYIRTLEDAAPAGHTIEVSKRDYVFCMSAKHITLDGIELFGSNKFGFWGDGDVSGLRIQNCIADYNAWKGVGIVEGTATVTSYVIDSNSFLYNGQSGMHIEIKNQSGGYITNNIANYNSRTVNVRSGGFLYTAGIYFFGNGKNGPTQVSGNTTNYNGYTQTSESMQTMGMGIWSDHSNNVNIYRNTAKNNWGPGIFLEKNVSTSVHHNILVNNGFADPYYDISHVWGQLCMKVGETTNGSGSSFYNNTVYGGYYGIKIFSDDTSTISDNIVKNNIAVGASNYNFMAGPGGNNDTTHGSGNVYTNNAFGAPGTTLAYWTGTGAITTYAGLDTAYGSAMHNASGDPLLTATYGLGAGSPAIDAGTPVFTAAQWLANGDAAGNHYVYGAGPDIGAYEKKKFIFDEDEMLPKKCRTTNAACYVQP